VSTPEKPRPSLDDTLARIDEAIDALAAEMAAQPHCRRCARQALIGFELCGYHLQLEPRETMIEDLGGQEEPPDFATINERRAEAGLPPIPAPLFAPIPPARPGWLARALRHLFT